MPRAGSVGFNEFCKKNCDYRHCTEVIPRSFRVIADRFVCIIKFSLIGHIPKVMSVTVFISTGSQTGPESFSAVSSI